MAEDAGGGLVVVFPTAIFPDEFLAEGCHLAGVAVFVAADANQAVGDVPGRLDFDVAVAGIGADGILWICITPEQVFRTVAAFRADIAVYTTGARVQAFGGCPVFKGAVLGTPPDKVGAVFFLVFRLVARRTRFPDAFVVETQGQGVFCQP